MMKHYFLLLIGLLLTGMLLILSSCEEKPMPEQFEPEYLTSLLEEAPDSVLSILQRVKHPENLSPEDQHNYALLHIRAKSKCNIDFMSDTAIFAASDYFLAAGSCEKAAWASFYCGRILREKGDFEHSLEYLLKAEEVAAQTDDSRLKGVIEFNLGAVLSERPELKKKSLAHFFVASDYFLHSGLSQAEKLRHENIRLQYHRNLFLLYVVSTLFFIVILLLLLHRWNTTNKQRALEAQHTIHELQQMARSFNEKENSFRTILLHHFNILKKAASLEMYITEDYNKRDQHLVRVISEIIYGQEKLNWELLYETMNQLYDGFFDRLREKYPQLDEAEFRICCLSYTKFSGSEIALIMKMSINTVQMKRSSIRKKIGVETFGNLNDFFDEILK